MAWTPQDRPTAETATLDNDLNLENDFPLESWWDTLWEKVTRTIQAWSGQGRQTT